MQPEEQQNERSKDYKCDQKRFEEFLAFLDLRVIGEDRFQGESRENAWPRVFGGVLLAHSVIAAYKNLEQKFEEQRSKNRKDIHSLHGYFMRPGRTDIPFVYAVEIKRAGKSFTLLSITAQQCIEGVYQDIFTALASFQRKEEGPKFYKENFRIKNHQNIYQSLFEDALFKDHANLLTQNYWQLQKPFIFCPIDLKNYLLREKKTSLNSHGFRLSGYSFDVCLTQAQRYALIAYMSDMTILDNALYQHNESIFSQRMQTGSLDHSLWFHNSFDFRDWLIYQIESPHSGNNRAFSRGEIYNKNGDLLVSVAQEGLMREKHF